MNDKEFQRLISKAIFREVESYTFYTEVAKRVEDLQAKELFLTLAEAEKGHEDLLDELRKNPRLAETLDAPGDNLGIAETQPLPELSVDMSPADAVSLAMKKEEHAAQVYARMAEATSDPQLKAYCKKFEAMELRHKQDLELLFLDVAGPQEWSRMIKRPSLCSR